MFTSYWIYTTIRSNHFCVCNVSFRTNKEKNQFSAIQLNANYSEFNQYWFLLSNDILFTKNRIRYIGDCRYYKLPTHTYGIGNSTQLSDAVPVDYTYFRCYQLLYKELIQNFYLGVGYNLDFHNDINTTLVQSTKPNEMNKPLNNTKSVSSGISLNTLYDSRNNPANPSPGNFANIRFRLNHRLLKSDNNWSSVVIDLRHYMQLPNSSKNILAFWSYTSLTLFGRAPYFDLPTTASDDSGNTGRGFVAGRYTGRNLAYIESEYRFHLTRNGLLGGVVFGNIETILKSGDISTKLLHPGYGAGLRVKVNKRSNINLSIDYAFGSDGTHGLFFNLGEIF